jgi:Homeodomain
MAEQRPLSVEQLAAAAAADADHSHHHHVHHAHHHHHDHTLAATTGPAATGAEVIDDAAAAVTGAGIDSHSLTSAAVTMAVVHLQQNALQAAQAAHAAHEFASPTTSASPAPGRPKRYHATPDQLQEMTALFAVSPSPSAEALNALSIRTAVPLQNLVLWFKNRRARANKRGGTFVAAMVTAASQADAASAGTGEDAEDTPSFRTALLEPQSGRPPSRRSYVKSGIYSKKTAVNTAFSIAAAAAAASAAATAEATAAQARAVKAAALAAAEAQSGSFQHQHAVAETTAGLHPDVAAAAVAAATIHDEHPLSHSHEHDHMGTDHAHHHLHHIPPHDHHHHHHDDADHVEHADQVTHADHAAHAAAHAAHVHSAHAAQDADDAEAAHAEHAVYAANVDHEVCGDHADQPPSDEVLDQLPLVTPPPGSFPASDHEICTAISAQAEEAQPAKAALEAGLEGPAPIPPTNEEAIDGDAQSMATETNPVDAAVAREMAASPAAPNSADTERELLLVTAAAASSPGGPASPLSLPTKLPPRFDSRINAAAAAATEVAVTAASDERDTKRRRVDMAHELIGDANPCSNWDSDACLNRFASFIAACTNSRFGEQVDGALAAARRFFFDELQNGLTITSAVQSLDQSLDALDQVMSGVTCKSGVKLNSGSRALLREFIFQIRSGRAHRS